MSTLYAITFDMKINGRRVTGTYELDMNQMTRSQIVRDILEGQYDNVDRVIEFDPDEHTCSDVTGDIAMDVAGQLLSQGSRCPEHLRDWLSEHYEILAPQRIDYAATGEAA